MVLQVGAVRHRMPDEYAEDREALHNVEQAGRTALAEMRRLLDAMRREDDGRSSRPSRVWTGRGLVERRPGSWSRCPADVQGDRVPLPPGLDLSAYRILQEG
jgi:signal transduction histidine kinase